jgi:hypothetical protein
MKQIKMNILEYAMIIGVTLGFIIFAVFIRCYIIYSYLKGKIK